MNQTAKHGVYKDKIQLATLYISYYYRINTGTFLIISKKKLYR